MKLFMGKSNSPIKRLSNNLEKIGKISALRISKDYTDSVIGDLEWIQDSFINVLALKEKNQKLFYELIDPNGRYKKTKSQGANLDEIDFSNFTFSLIDQLPPELEIDPLKKKYRKVYDSFDPEKLDDLQLRYIQTIFTIWIAATAKENRQVQKYCLYTFVNWMTIVDKLDDPDFDYPTILVIFLQNLWDHNFMVLNTDADQQPAAYSLFSYNNYLNRIFSDDIYDGNVDIYFDYLFRFLYQIIESKKFSYAESFISRCIDSSYYPDNRGAYSNLHSLIYRKMNEAGTEGIDELLKPIPELGFYRVGYIWSVTELKSWETEFYNFIEDKIEPIVPLDEEITKQVKAIKTYAKEVYKFNKLQIVVLKLLSLCLFKGDTKTIKFALQYNQPADSNAIQGNKDILPVHLHEILNFVNYKYSMEHELFSFWGGHHGVEYYLDQILCIVLYRYNPSRYYGVENAIASTTAFCKFKLNDDPGSVEGLKQNMVRLKKTFNFHAGTGKLKEEFFSSEKKIAKTNAIVDEIIAACEQVLAKIEETAPLTEESKTGFLISIIEDYHKYNYLNKFFKAYGQPTTEIPEGAESIGINEMMDRTAFMENWHIPYYGFVENRARELADADNRNAQFLLAAKSKEVKLDQGDIANALDNYVDKGYVVIFRNLHLDMVLRGVENYKPFYDHPDQENIVPGFYQGLYKDIPIFGLYDQLFSESFLILNKKDLFYNEYLGEVNLPFTAHEDFKMSFIDFGTDDASLQGMIDRPPLWIQEEFKGDNDKLNSYLKKKVWIRLFKKVHYNVGENFECYLFDLP
ncbi:MAG: hypothetical protein K0S09_1471 [Sphingobacteriaceae bacterium]|nr:hypothetical protein [Sphingobacteriaceae bacterium]